MGETADILVVGGGMAGASAAAHLADLGRVLLVEAEDAFGYHTTGRSSAMFDETYGNEVVRALTASSRDFYQAPPAGFVDHPLLTRRGGVQFANLQQWPTLLAKLDLFRSTAPMMVAIDSDQCRALVPCLKPEVVLAGLYDPALADIDVHATHQGFLKLARRQGVEMHLSAPVLSARRETGGWSVETPSGRISAGLIVDAAGAWGDELAALCDVAPIGIEPRRRTAFTFETPGFDIADWPVLFDADERFYMKPQTGLMLATPCDATPSPPADVQPEEMDVAMGAALIEEATTLEVRRIVHKWAGLRSFAPDMTPVVGRDPDQPDFFWLVGQGGYGIQTSPAMGRVTRSLIEHGTLPDDVLKRGVTPNRLSPARFNRAPKTGL